MTMNSTRFQRGDGMLARLGGLAYKVAQRTMTFDVARLMCLEAACAQTIAVENLFSFRFLTADEVHRHSYDPANQMSSSFAERVLCGRDLCYAALKGRTLAGYAWLALGSIEAEQNRGRNPRSGVAASFRTDTAFVYKAFTRPEFRGRRLYSACLVGALDELAARGICKLLVTTDWTNHSALASCRRAGCHELGSLARFGWPGAIFTLTPRGAAALGIQFGSRARPDVRSPNVEDGHVDDDGAVDDMVTVGHVAETFYQRPAVLN